MSQYYIQFLQLICIYVLNVFLISSKLKKADKKLKSGYKLIDLKHR